MTQDNRSLALSLRSKLILSMIGVLLPFIVLEGFFFIATEAAYRFKKVSHPPVWPHLPHWDRTKSSTMAFGAPDVAFGFRLNPYAAHGQEMGLRINASGFIANTSDGRDVSFHKPAGTYRIMIYGGSTVQGLGASANEKTIAAQLERLLNERKTSRGIHYEVINAGVGGYFSTQELLYFLTEGVFYQPDTVIVLDGLNDFHRIHGEWLEATEQNSYTRGLPSALKYRFHPAQLPSTNASFTNFPLSGLLSPLFPNTLKALRRLSAPPQRGLLNVHYSEPLNAAKGSDCYISNLQSFMGASLKHHIRCLVLLQPTLGFQKESTREEESHWNHLEADYIGQKTRYWAMVSGKFHRLQADEKSGQARAIDLSGLFVSNHDTLYSDTEHYNDHGQLLIAMEIARRLQYSEFLAGNGIISNQ